MLPNQFTGFMQQRLPPENGPVEPIPFGEQGEHTKPERIEQLIRQRGYRPARKHIGIAVGQGMCDDVGLADIIGPQGLLATRRTCAVDHVHGVSAPGEFLGELGPTASSDPEIGWKRMADDQDRFAGTHEWAKVEE